MVDGSIIKEEKTEREIYEEKIHDFGALNYKAGKIASILGENVADIEKKMKEETNDFMKMYRRGRNMADYVLDKKLFEMARAGDLAAMKRYEFKIKN
jgi:endonuclease III